MIMENSIHFTGFEQKAIDFLENLKNNNNKPWFDENRQIYNQYIVEPMQCLITELSSVLLSIDPLIETTPAIGKTISRMNRDTRFSNDKSPYRSNVWVTFKRPVKEWQDSPGFFFELSPSSYRYGMGFYSAKELKECEDIRMSLDETFVESLKLVESCYIAMVGSNANEGYPNIKAMIKVEAEGIKTIWFSTNTSSKRVSQFKQNPKACVYFADQNNFKGLMLVGDIEVLSDIESKKRLWREGCEIYYPLGVDDPDYSVLCFKAKWGNYYHGLKNVSFEL